MGAAVADDLHLSSEPGFHVSNGRPVVAADVVGSLKRVLDPETAAFWAVQLGTIKEIVADDDHTVRVVFERPHTPFLAAVSMITTSILPMKELNEGTFDPKAEMLGSGPFMVKEHLQTNPGRWRATRISGARATRSPMRSRF